MEGKETSSKDSLIIAGEPGEPVLIKKTMDPYYLVCNICGQPYLHTKYSDLFLCDGCLRSHDRMVGTE